MRSRIEVRHAYHYAYSAPIADVRQRLIMVPPDAHLDQHLDRFSLDVRGADPGWTLEWDQDTFGNRVGHVRAPGVQAVIEFEAHYIVDMTEPGVSRFDRRSYLTPTALTAPDERLSAAAAGIARYATSHVQRAEAAHDWAAQALEYQAGYTGVRTPAAMALHLGRGVCQDYAHLLLCVLRLLDLPARYVSGHLLGEGAPHAWVEALVDKQVIAYDPSHHRRTDERYVTVAVGRDYADVAPTSGTFTGSAAGVLSGTKYAGVVDTRTDSLA